MSANKTAGYAPYDHPLPYVMVEAAGGDWTKGDLVKEGDVIGFTEQTVATGDRYRLNTEVPQYATKATPTEVLTVGMRVEFVAAGEGETSGTVQEHDQGIGFATVAEDSGASDTTVLVQPDRALYL